MKIGLSKLKFSFVILFSTLLSISPFNPVRLTDSNSTLEVCAQDVDYKDLGTGTQCIKRYDSCIGGKNLFDLARRGEIEAPTRFNTDIQKLREYEYICVPPSVISINYVYDGEHTIFNDIDDAKHYYLCTTPGYSPSSADSMTINKNLGGNKTTLCCPTGFSAAGKPGTATSNPFGNSEIYGVGRMNYACCPILDPSEYPDLNQRAIEYGKDPSGNFACSYTGKNGPGRFIPIWDLEISQRYTQDDLIDTTVNSKIVGTSLGRIDDNFSTPIDYDQGVADLYNFYQNCSPGETHQFGAETVDCNEILATRMTILTENKYKCQNANGCFIESATGAAKNISNINESRECTRCFGPGEPVSVDSTTQLMNICDPTAANSIKTQPLCNSSVIDTIACLGGSNSASQNADSSGVYDNNYDLCCACREQGGVWTGIGCTDTTPSGLITGLIRIVYGVMGGVALIMLIYAGIMYQTGNEANVKKARESIIRTVTGLIVLTFSILILRVIGINVLDILPTGSI